MKRFFLIVLLTPLFFGCAGIQKQNQINEQMKNYVFKAPPAEIYKTAEKVFKGMYTELKSDGKFQGSSQWLTQNSTLGGKSYQEKSRFTVKIVETNSEGSKLRIHRENQSNLTGEWRPGSPGRMLIYEYNVLKELNPKAAQKIELAADTKSS